MGNQGSIKLIFHLLKPSISCEINTYQEDYDIKIHLFCLVVCGRHGGLMVSALNSGASALGSSPGRGHCVVFLGKTLYSHSASLHPGV